MEKRKFLVVVDPSHERHLALERMLDIISQRREWISDFHLLIGFEGADKADPKAPTEVIRGKTWFDQLLAPLQITQAGKVAQRGAPALGIGDAVAQGKFE